MKLRCRLGMHDWILVDTMSGSYGSVMLRRDIYWCAICVKTSHKWIR